MFLVNEDIFIYLSECMSLSSIFPRDHQIKNYQRRFLNPYHEKMLDIIIKKSYKINNLYLKGKNS